MVETVGIPEVYVTNLIPASKLTFSSELKNVIVLTYVIFDTVFATNAAFFNLTSATFDAAFTTC